MRLSPILALVAATGAFATTALAHEALDHAPPSGAIPASPPSSNFIAGGEGAKWELLKTIFTGNPHSDIDFFQHKGETYLSSGVLGVGPNGGGQTIVQLTDKGQVSASTPKQVGTHPAAACPAVFTGATALQHDVEATPKSGVILNDRTSTAPGGDAQLLIDATDGAGRCHDNGTLGAQGAPPGGLEIIDITDPTKPREIGLIRSIGNAHTVNVDPKRPHIAFIVTQDSTGVNADGRRANETSGSALDGFEIVDLSSCMNFPATATLAQKREACDPQVYRYRYPQPEIALSHTFPNRLQSCHELEVYADDKIACASITATALFDMSGAFDEKGKPIGTPLPCPSVSSSSAQFGTGAKVQDCVTGLNVRDWIAKGSPSIQGIKWLGTVPHMGFQETQDIANTKYDATQDIIAAHESEFTQSGRFVITSDERGGGVVPPESTCAPMSNDANKKSNGGLHFFPTSAFTTNPPKTFEEASKQWARQPNGQKAVFRATPRSPKPSSSCTSHVFQQIPGQNRIFMGYYQQGTQVVDFVENPDGTITFKEAGYFIPENANTWVSQIFKMQQNADGTWTYFGATGDGILPGTGRSAIDVYKVTLPAPPKPAGDATTAAANRETAGQGTTTTGQNVPGANAVVGAGGRCVARVGFKDVDIEGRGRGLRIGFDRAVRKPVDVDVFRQSAGDRVTGEALAARFRGRRGSFTWSGRGARDGVYIVRMQMNLGGNDRDTRRIVVERRNGRWSLRPAYYRPVSCGVLRSAKLERPVFGGRNTNALLVSFRLAQQARVTVVVRDSRGRVARRFPARTYASGRTHRLRVPARFVRKGLARVDIEVQRGQTQTATRLVARRL